MLQIKCVCVEIKEVGRSKRYKHNGKDLVRDAKGAPIEDGDGPCSVALFAPLYEDAEQPWGEITSLQLIEVRLSDIAGSGLQKGDVCTLTIDKAKGKAP